MTGSVIQRDSGPNIYSSFIIEWILFKTNKQKPRVDISPPVFPEDKATHSKWCGEETRKTLVPVYCSPALGLVDASSCWSSHSKWGGGWKTGDRHLFFYQSLLGCGRTGKARTVGTNMPSWSFWELRGALRNRLCEMKASEASEQRTNSGTLPFLELSKTWDPNNTSE